MKFRFYINFLDDPNKGKNIALSDAIDAINRYDLILFLEPDVAFVQDGDRSIVIQNDRYKYSEQIKEIFRNHSKKFVTISGNYQERFLQAITEVNRLFEV